MNAPSQEKEGLAVRDRHFLEMVAAAFLAVTIIVFAVCCFLQMSDDGRWRTLSQDGYETSSH